MNTFGDLLARLDRTTAGVTFIDGPLYLSYETLAARVRGNADHFRRSGISRGDRVAIALETDVEHVVTFLALIAMGAVPVSVKPRRGSVQEYAEELRTILVRFSVRFAYRTLSPISDIESVSWDEAASATAGAIDADITPEDVAFIQFSSGSLGDPKAIPIRHGSMMHNLRVIPELAGVDASTADAVAYNFLPLSHDMGLVGGFLSSLVFQNPVYLSSTQSFLRRPTAFFAQHRRCDGVPMPDFALRYLLRHLDARRRSSDESLLAGVRTIFCGAEPIRESTVESLVDAASRYGLDPRAVVFCYGMAEATLVVTARRFTSLAEAFAVDARGRKTANVGRPVTLTEVVSGSRDSTGHIAPCGVGVEGELFVRGPGVFRGYVDSAPLADAWHDTGDVGFIRDGDVYVSGRLKDVIIVNGENLFPQDIEAFVSRAPGVTESLVMADGDRFYLFIVSRPSFDAAEIAASVAARFGVAPSGVVVGAAGDIPRTSSGKAMRQAMLADLRRRGVVAP